MIVRTVRQKQNGIFKKLLRVYYALLFFLIDPGSVDDERQSTYSKRQNLLFSAITSFAMKNSMGEVEKYYAAKMRQAPHVISYYTAGVRLIGLNDRQLEQVSYNHL